MFNLRKTKDNEIWFMIYEKFMIKLYNVLENSNLR